MKKTDAIAHFGSAAELARKLGISEAAVSRWGEDVPTSKGRAYQIEVMTGGKLKADPSIKPQQPTPHA